MIQEGDARFQNPCSYFPIILLPSGDRAVFCGGGGGDQQWSIVAVVWASAVCDEEPRGLQRPSAPHLRMSSGLHRITPAPPLFHYLIFGKKSNSQSLAVLYMVFSPPNNRVVCISLFAEVQLMHSWIKCWCLNFFLTSSLPSQLLSRHTSPILLINIHNCIVPYPVIFPTGPYYDFRVSFFLFFPILTDSCPHMEAKNNLLEARHTTSETPLCENKELIGIIHN